MAEKHSQQDTLIGPLPATYRFWVDDPNVKTYQVHPDKITEYANDQRLGEWVLSGAYRLSSITRHATYRYVTGAVVHWPNGATDGALQNVTAHGSFPHLVSSLEFTYPDGPRTVTLTLTRDATNGDVTAQTVTIS